jgi:hypothetical protein
MILRWNGQGHHDAPRAAARELDVKVPETSTGEAGLRDAGELDDVTADAA